MNLDSELVREAGEILGTSQTTETIHRALQEVVDREMRRRLAELPLTELTPESLDRMRRGRSFQADNPSA